MHKFNNSCQSHLSTLDEKIWRALNLTIITLFVCMYYLICICLGYPTSELALRGSKAIKVLNDEEQEMMRVACRVSIIHLIMMMMMMM